MHYRAEAAEQLIYHRADAIADILKNSAIQALRQRHDSSVEAAIDLHLKILTASLLYGDEVLSTWSRMRHQQKFDPFSNSVGIITLTHIRNYICAPRDMSAAAAAAEKVLLSLPPYRWHYEQPER